MSGDSREGGRADLGRPWSQSLWLTPGAERHPWSKRRGEEGSWSPAPGEKRRGGHAASGCWRMMETSGKEGRVKRQAGGASAELLGDGVRGREGGLRTAPASLPGRRPGIRPLKRTRQRPQGWDLEKMMALLLDMGCVTWQVSIPGASRLNAGGTGRGPGCRETLIPYHQRRSLEVTEVCKDPQKQRVSRKQEWLRAGSEGRRHWQDGKNQSCRRSGEGPQAPKLNDSCRVTEKKGTLTAPNASRARWWEEGTDYSERVLHRTMPKTGRGWEVNER